MEDVLLENVDPAENLLECGRVDPVDPNAYLPVFTLRNNGLFRASVRHEVVSKHDEFQEAARLPDELWKNIASCVCRTWCPQLSKIGTAFTLSPNLILMTAHNVYPEGDYKEVSICFEDYALVNVATEWYVVDEVARLASEDLAVFKSTRRLPATAFCVPCAEPPAQGASVVLASYPGDPTAALKTAEFGSVTPTSPAAQRKALSHADAFHRYHVRSASPGRTVSGNSTFISDTCAASSGSSGGPLFQLSVLAALPENSKFLPTYGLHKGAGLHVGSPQATNTGIRFDRSEVQAWLAEVDIKSELQVEPDILEAWQPYLSATFA